MVGITDNAVQKLEEIKYPPKNRYGTGDTM